MKQIETLKFKKFCMSIGNLPSSYVESLSYYECLMWLCKYLQETVIPTVNNNGEAVTELQNLFLQLQQYVENYFENLDVQEEINNKLDEMVEDGTLETIIGHYIYNNILGSLNFRTIQKYESSLEEYQGYSHEYAQGMCKIDDDNVIFATRNPYDNDNIVKLTEYKLSTGAVLRSVYLELGHCNSMTYNPNTGKIYVAPLSFIEDGVVVNNNNLYELNYDDLSLNQIIELSNISTHQLRSVDYNEDDDQLYGADTDSIYKINLITNTISDVVTLSRTNIQPLSINQVVKKYKGNYIALNISNLIVYNLDGSIFREINIERVEQNQMFGEPEDFITRTNGDIIIMSMKRLSGYRNYRTIAFNYSNLYTNTNNIIRSSIGGDETRQITLYVDINSNESIEDGTNVYPFKDIQSAINYASNSTRSTIINILAGTYDRIIIRNISNLMLSFNEACILDGVNIVNSNVTISNENDLTIKGINITKNSNVELLGTTDHYININNANLNKPLYADYNNIIYARHCIFKANNTNNCIDISRNTTLTLEDCTLDEYTAYYGITSDYQGYINLFNCTFNISSSTSQHKIYLGHGCIINSQNDLNSYNDYVKEDSSAKIYGTTIKIPLVSTFYYGDVADIDLKFDMLRVITNYPTASSKQIHDMKCVNDSNGTIACNIWGNNISLKHGIIQYRIYNNKLTIQNNRSLYLAASGDYTYNYTTSNTPDDTSIYSGITELEYYDN